jgi:hypothetical protein
MIPLKETYETNCIPIAITKGSTESLKDCIESFNQERLTVVDTQEKLTLASLVNGLSP